MVDRIKVKIEKDKDFLPDEEESPENFLDLFALLMHTSDLNAPTRSFKLHNIWAKRINNEFLEQLDDEINSGL